MVKDQDIKALEMAILKESEGYNEQKLSNVKNSELSEKLFSYQRELQEFEALLD